MQASGCLNAFLKGIANHSLPFAVRAAPQASPLPPSLPASSAAGLIAFFVDALRTGQARCAIGRLHELLDHFHSDGGQLPGGRLEAPKLARPVRMLRKRKNPLLPIRSQSGQANCGSLQTFGPLKDPFRRFADFGEVAAPSAKAPKAGIPLLDQPTGISRQPRGSAGIRRATAAGLAASSAHRCRARPGLNRAPPRRHRLRPQCSSPHRRG